MPTRPKNTLAFVSRERRLLLFDPDLAASEPVPLKSAANIAADAPAWSPDEGHLAFVGEEEGLAETSIYVASLPEGKVRLVYSDAGARPFYLAWSPDARRIAFLAQTAEGLALRVARADGEPGDAAEVMGQPSFFHWGATGTELLVHIGGSAEQNPDAFMGLLDTGTGMLFKFDQRPAEFRTPSWSPDGRHMLAAARTSTGNAILSIDRRGAAGIVSRFQGKAAFLWSPAGDRVGILSSAEVQDPLYRDGLAIADVDGRGQRLVAQGEIMAFFWSPDGSRAVYFALDRTRGALTLFVVNADGQDRKRLADLLPSQGLAMLLTFFDQYALSGSLWSPDGRWFTYAGRPPATPGAEADNTPDAVFVVPVDASAPPRRIAEGSLGVFPKF